MPGKNRPSTQRVRILFLTKYDQQGASSRYRVYQFMPFLERLGYHCEIRPLLPGGGSLRRDLRGIIVWCVATMWAVVRRLFDLVLSARSFSLVVIQKEIIPHIDGRFLGRLSTWSGRPVVRDFDDADFVKNPKLGQSVANAELVIAGNGTIEAWARKHCDRVLIIPTVVEVGRYDKLVHVKAFRARARDVLRIAWIGTPSTVRYLDVVSGALVAASRQRDIRLEIMGAVWEHHGIAVNCTPWSYEREVEFLMTCDVGIMPLKNSPWEEGKCGLKLLQYMAARLPVVTSPVGVSKEIVRDGVEGFLADAENQWVDAILALCDNSELRVAMGQRGYDRVRSAYSLEVWGPKYGELLRNVIESGGRQ